MKNVTKLTVSAIALCGGALTAAPALAQEGPTVSGNVAMVTDYRFRGVSLSDEDFAIQGGLDLGWDSGFYLGTWASSIEQLGNGSEVELDFYTGFGGDMGALSYDVGVIAYLYPDDNLDDNWYGEIYASLGGEAGIASWTVGAAYAPEQDNIGDEDNIYVFVDGEVPFGDSPAYGFAHAGFEAGAFGDKTFGDDKLDWALGVGTAFAGVDLSLAYVGFDAGPVDDDSIVFSIGSSW